MPENKICPVCHKYGVVAYGSSSQEFCWFEHSCGSFSPPGKDWDHAYALWEKSPEFIDPAHKHLMHPPCGGGGSR